MKYEAIDHAYKLYCKTRFDMPADVVLQIQMAVSLELLGRETATYLKIYNGGIFTKPSIPGDPYTGRPSDKLDVMFGGTHTHDYARLDLEVYFLADPDVFGPSVKLVGIGYTHSGNMITAISGGRYHDGVALKICYSTATYLLARTIYDYFGMLAD